MKPTVFLALAAGALTTVALLSQIVSPAGRTTGPGVQAAADARAHPRFSRPARRRPRPAPLRLQTQRKDRPHLRPRVHGNTA